VIYRSALKERFFSASDLPVGSIVTATVTGFAEKSLTISVGAVSGYISWYHTSDSPIPTLTDKFNVGQKIKGRVSVVTFFCFFFFSFFFFSFLFFFFFSFFLLFLFFFFSVFLFFFSFVVKLPYILLILFVPTT